MPFCWKLGQSMIIIRSTGPIHRAIYEVQCKTICSSLNTNKKNRRLGGGGEYGEYTRDRNMTEITENLL